MKEAASILFAAGLVYAAALSLGLTFLRRLKLDLAAPEERFLGLLSGAALLSSIVFALAAARLAYTSAYVGLAAACVAAFWRFAFRRGPTRVLPPMPRAWNLLFWVCYGAYLFYYLPNAMALETSPDGVTYHVGLIARYFQVHSYQWTTKNMYADFPQGMEMLFLMAYSLAAGLGRQSAAAMVHFSFLAALPFGMLAWGRRFGMPGAAVSGALLFFVMPVVGKAGTSAYNDVALAATLFALFYTLQIWAASPDSRLLVLVGVLAGFAYALKYTGFLALPFALVYVIYYLRREPRTIPRAAWIVCACALAMILPWALKDFVVVGNPFAPFFNAYFPNPYFHVQAEHEYTLYMAHVNNVSYRDIPMEAFRGYKLIGLAGPLLLISPLALLALRNGVGRALLLAAVIFGSTYFANIGLRFLMPALLFLSLALGVGLAWRGVGVLLVLAQVVLSWPPVMALYVSPYAWRITDAPWRIACVRQGEDQYLARKIGDSYDMARLVEAKTPAGATIFEMSDTLPRAYMDREVDAAYLSAWGRNMAAAIEAAEYNGAQATWLDHYRFPAQQLQRIRLVETQRSDRDPWTVNELRFFFMDRELPRSSQWQLRAWPNPWDVKLAFDGNPVTRWSSWEYFHSGMYIDIDFGAPRELDELTTLSRPLQRPAEVRLEQWTPSGWRALAVNHQRIELPVPARLRKAAEEYLKSGGVRWLVVDRGSWAFEDLLKNRVQWDMTPVAYTRDHVLYRLD